MVNCNIGKYGKIFSNVYLKYSKPIIKLEIVRLQNLYYNIMKQNKLTKKSCLFHMVKYNLQLVIIRRNFEFFKYNASYWIK